MSITWMELHEMAETVAHQAAISVAWLSLQEEMVFLSEAQHQLQMHSGVCKRTVVIDLSGLASDGSVAIPGGLKSITVASYSATTALSPRPVYPVGYARFNEMIYGYQTWGSPYRNPPINPNPVLPQIGGGLILAAQYDKFWIYPFVGATGFLTIQYIPSLQAYSPSDSTLWPGFGADPAAAMAANGPEPEMQAVSNAIYEYCAAQLFRISPLGLKVWQREYSECMAKFEMGQQQLSRTVEDYTASRRPAYSLGGFR